jgi:hypothetical protein
MFQTVWIVPISKWKEDMCECNFVAHRNSLGVSDGLNRKNVPVYRKVYK